MDDHHDNVTSSEAEPGMYSRSLQIVTASSSSGFLFFLAVVRLLAVVFCVLEGGLRNLNIGFLVYLT